MVKTIGAIATLITAITQLIGVLAQVGLIPKVPTVPFKILPKIIQGKNPFKSGMNPNHVPNAKVLTAYINEYASDDVEALAKFWDRRSPFQEK
jgi:hypothetical protein